jgi:hypothetical protein
MAQYSLSNFKRNLLHIEVRSQFNVFLANFFVSVLLRKPRSVVHNKRNTSKIIAVVIKNHIYAQLSELFFSHLYDLVGARTPGRLVGWHDCSSKDATGCADTLEKEMNAGLDVLAEEAFSKLFHHWHN